MNRVIEDKLIQLFNGTQPVHKDCKNVITKIDDNRYVIARTLDIKHALMELIEIFDENKNDNKLRNFLQHDELTELREHYEYIFGK